MKLQLHPVWRLVNPVTWIQAQNQTSSAEVDQAALWSAVPKGWKMLQREDWLRMPGREDECRDWTQPLIAWGRWFHSGVKIRSCPSMRPFRWLWATSWLSLEYLPKQKDTVRNENGLAFIVSTFIRRATTTTRDKKWPQTAILTHSEYSAITPNTFK